MLLTAKGQGDGHHSSSVSPFRTGVDFKDALIAELRLEENLTKPLYDLIRVGVRFYGPEILDLHPTIDISRLLDHMQDVSSSSQRWSGTTNERPSGWINPPMTSLIADV